MLRLFRKGMHGLEEFDLLNGSINIPLTQAQTDPTNPTKITTEYSKSVKLPLTPKNLQLVGYYTELDSVVSDLGTLGNFRPTIALPVVVLNDNDIIFEGKLKLDKVNDYKGNRTMECTLYGKMNDYFNLMLNTSYWWDSINEAAQQVNSAGMYVLPNILDEGYNICKETVLESWRTLPNSQTASAPFHQATLNPTVSNTYDPTTSQSHSVIAWAPSEQGYYANFEKDKVIIGGYTKSGDTYTPDICFGGTQNGVLVDIYGKTDELRYITVTEEQKAIAEVVAGEGFSERQWCQYRSYYQKPTIYVNQLWKQYQELSEAITGLKLELDEDWFNASNPRFTDIVYTLPDLQQEKKKETGGGSQNTISWSAPTLDCHDYAFGTDGGTNTTITLTGNSTTNGHIVVPSNNTGYCNFNINLGVYLRRRGGLSNSSEFELCNGDGTASCIDIQVAFRNIADNTEVNTYNFKIVDENNTSWQASSVDELIRMSRKTWNPDPQTIYFNLQGNVLIGQNNTSASKEYEMVVSAYCYNGNIDNGSGKALFQTRGRISNVNALCGSCNDNPTFTFTNVVTTINVSAEYRSNFNLTMKDLFPANYSPFNILLQYTKLFNLVWHYDQMRDKVTVMTKEKWFNMYANDILDWTEKVDKSREFFFKPLAWDKKYITFNYDDFEMDWLKDFKDRYNITYGTKRITTQYNFNNETEELMCTNDSDKINPSIQVSMSRFPVSSLTNTDPVPLRYYETFIGNRKDGKSANAWGQFYFRNGVKNWDSDNGKNNVYTNCNTNGSWATPAFRNFGISLVDDTTFQIRRKIFAVDMTVYASASDRRVQVPFNTRPIFSVFDKSGQYSCQFSKPAMTFYDNDAPEMQKTVNVIFHTFNVGPVDLWANDVYTDRWSNIIEEQYNEQNKLLTCYVKLSDVDYRKLTCNRFVKIGNVLYTIYKVDDFQLGIGGLTKVTLLQVWNMNKYLGSYYVEPEPAPEPLPPDPYETPFYIEDVTNQYDPMSATDVYLAYYYTRETDKYKFIWEWSLDLVNWNQTEIVGGLGYHQRVYLRAKPPVGGSMAWSDYYTYFNRIVCAWQGNARVKFGGNILSLLYGNEFTNQRDFPSSATSFTFCGVFQDTSNVVDASELLLPSTVTPYCYANAFESCSRLRTSPVLPATTLATYCYATMFSGDNVINNVTCLATDISAASCTSGWLNSAGNTGTFTCAAGMTNTWSRGINGIPTGWSVVEQ